MSDCYDSRGRLLDGPDDEPACIPHGNLIDFCAECRADWEREEAEYRAFRIANPLTGDRPEGAEAFKDLPY